MTPITASPLTAQFSMGVSAPDPIPTVTSTNATTNGGRHRTFEFIVPADNGRPIEQYVVRRANASTTVYYNISCAGVGSTLPPYDYGEPSVSYSTPLTCTAGQTVSFTLGSNLWPYNEKYIVPTYTYDWTVIGAPGSR
jgi:hypothetical protein